MFRDCVTEDGMYGERAFYTRSVCSTESSIQYLLFSNVKCRLLLSYSRRNARTYCHTRVDVPVLLRCLVLFGTIRSQMTCRRCGCGQRVRADRWQRCGKRIVRAQTFGGGLLCAPIRGCSSEEAFCLG